MLALRVEFLWVDGGQPVLHTAFIASLSKAASFSSLGLLHFPGSYSVLQFIHSVMSNSLWPHGLQHVRPPCPSPAPRVYSNSCPLTRWWPPTIPSSVVPFSSCPQSFPASGSFPVSQFFASGGPRIGVSTSASILPMNIQDWFLLGWIGWISLQSQGLSRVFSSTTVHHIWLIFYWMFCVSTEFLVSWGAKCMNFAISHGLRHIGDSYSVSVNWIKERMNCIMSYPFKSNVSTELSKILHGMGCHFHG